MAERRKHRKRNAGTPPGSKKLSLLDLPPPADPRDELPTNPAYVIRPEQRSTLIPAAAEPYAEPYVDVSLASLALAARRSDPFPPEPAPLPRAAFVVKPTESIRPIPSSMPPPVQMPSEPPRRRSSRHHGSTSWLRTLGVIVLSSSVGATVASLISSARSGLDGLARGERGGEDLRAAAPAASCAPTTTSREPPASVHASVSAPGSSPLETATGKSSQDAPRITLDALPLQPGRRGGRAAETISLDSAPSDRADRRARPATPRAAPPAESTPVQPSRATLSQAMSRAASAATSCDTSPQDGKVTVTFAPSGNVQSVSLVKGFGDTAVNACVLRAFGRARVPEFSGDPVQVRKSVAW
jgi:hypothetical protein